MTWRAWHGPRGSGEHTWGSRIEAPTLDDVRALRRPVSEWTDDGIALHDPPRTVERTWPTDVGAPRGRVPKAKP